MFEIGAWLAKSVLLGRIKSAVQSIPKKAWLYIAIVAAILLGVVWHQVHAHNALKAQFKAGYVQRGIDDDKQLAKEHAEAVKWKAQAESLHNQLAQKIKDKNDEKARHIDVAAHDLLRSGPGKAGCGQVRNSSPAPSASGYSTTIRTTQDAGLGQVSNPEWSTLMAVPFNDLVAFAKAYDLNRDKLEAIYENDKKQREVWPNTNSKVDKSSK